MAKIVITAEFDEENLAELRKEHEVIFAGWGKTGKTLEPKDLIEVAADADYLIVEHETVNDDVFAALNKIRFVASCRGNPVNVDITAATAKGVPVLNTPGRNRISVAELTMAFTLALSRNVVVSDKWTRTGEWEKDRMHPYFTFRGPELLGKKLGLIGFGAIGHEVAVRAKSFGMEILVYDPFVDSDSIEYQVLSLEKLMAQADIVSIHCPFNEQTKGLISRELLFSMKPDAYFINTARAGIVDEQGLIDVIQEGKIAGAAMDVYWKEPVPVDHPLIKSDRVILTPHIGGASPGVIKRHSEMICEEIQRSENGETLKWVVNG